MYNNKKILAVVIARKGSKGIVGKNYRKLLEKPLFIWSVLAALDSNYIDVVAISSNCPYVKKEYLSFMAENDSRYNDQIYWIDRPDEYATDTAKNELALIHAYDIIKNNLNFLSDLIVNLQPTSPCRLNGLIDKCIKHYFEQNADSLLTADKDTPFIWQKINNEWQYTVDKNDCCNRKMRQDFRTDEMIWHDNGCLYLTDSNILLNKGCRIGNKPCVFETDKISSLQIDEEIDFEIIENIIKSKNIKNLF